MGKYFGTDGARGKANENLTLDMAIKIGQYLGYYFSTKTNRHAKIIIGKDTRLSSDMFELGIAAGAISTGANVYQVGICPTPCVSYLISKDRFDCGVMISASHNPYYDNGIKLFNNQGKKMDKEIEDAIEAYIDGEINIELAKDKQIGRMVDYTDALAVYKMHLKEVVNYDLEGLNIAVDLANGSATSCAVEVLRDLGANVKVIHSNPNGININTNCGSTHPESLQSLMETGQYDVGFAFDGDADRLIAVNEDGDLFDGDYILYVCGKYLKKQGTLNDDTVVTTVMANLGLYKAFEKVGINSVQTQVGDKYVFQEMEAHDYVLGGEQSGHIIFKDYASTGDGLLTALMLLNVMKAENKSLKYLAEDLFIYPQLLKNVRVQDKNKTLEDEGLTKLIENISNELGDDGRILVRASGTEPLIRVMVEAKTDTICEKYVNQVIDYITDHNL